MGKLVLALSFVAVSILLVFGLTAPDDPVMWLASTSPEFALVRLGILVALLALLVTNPPRNAVLRGIVGLFALGIAGWSISATYQNQMQFLDSMSLLLFSISASIAVLERTSEELFETIKPVKQAQQDTEAAAA